MSTVAARGVVDLEGAKLFVSEAHRRHQRVVFTNGVFDLLHTGHLHYLEEARSLGDVLIVAVNSDASTRLLKGPSRPIMPEADRVAMVAGLRCVDIALLFSERTANNLIEALQPDLYVKGGDYGSLEVAAARIPELASVVAYGGRVELLSFVEGRSTTALIERIRQQA
jgi:D-beta-D-heptose 7-phosphate kinase/D-beta-D-heptose 1-phosphate adenosyltransferase